MDRSEGLDVRKLKEEFPEGDIEWRIQKSGKSEKGNIWAIIVAYITNRAIQDRLDAVCGPENWQNHYDSGPDGGVLCGIEIFITEERSIIKWDGAENTNIEAVKGGLSDSMKRAAVQWGIGRYLYSWSEEFAVIGDNYSHRAKLKDGTRFKWDAPRRGDRLPRSC